MFLGVVALVIVVAAGISKLFSDAKDAGLFPKRQTGPTQEEITKTLVKRERHAQMLEWLDNKENFPEIQEHVSSVLSKIWGREVHYIPKHWASNDIRKVIYFVENGFLPGSFESDLYRVMWTNADDEPFGLSRLEKDEKEKLYLWVVKTMRETVHCIVPMTPGGLWTYAEPIDWSLYQSK